MRKGLITIISYILTIIFFFLVSRYDHEDYLIFIETIGLAIAVGMFLISYIRNRSENITFIRTFGYGVLVGGIFFFLHAVANNENDLNLVNYGYQLLLFAIIIQVSIFISAMHVYRKSVNLNRFYLFFFIITSIGYLLIKNGLVYDSINTEGNLTIYAKIILIISILLYIFLAYLVSKFDRVIYSTKNIMILFGYGLTIISVALHLIFKNGTFTIMLSETTRILGLILIFHVMLKILVIAPLNTNIENLSNEIGNLKNAVLETKKNERIFRLLYNDAPLGYQSLDIDGKFITVNDIYSKMLGYKERDMKGKYFKDFLTENSKKQFEKNFIEFKNKGACDFLYELKKANNDVVPIRFIGKISKDNNGKFKQTHCILMDVSNEIEYNKGIIDSKMKLENIVEATSEGRFTVDLKGVCTSINNTALRLLGYTYDERELFIGKRIHNIIHHSYEDRTKIPESLCPVFASMDQARDVFREEEILWTKDGNWIEVEFTSYPIIEYGLINGAIVTFRDNKINNDITEALINMSYHDSLTGLFNRRYYEDELNNLDNEKNYPISIIAADINGLKMVNDAFGHKSGDVLIQYASEVLNTYSNKKDLIARAGGDEFIIIKPRTSYIESEEIIDKMILECNKYNTNSIGLSISFGLATKTDSSQNIHEVYTKAENMMYRNKLFDVPSNRTNTIDTILNTLFEKDEASELHSRNVSKLAKKIAEESDLSLIQINEIKTAGLLHDIGKIIIPTEILKKEGKLTDYEYTEIKKHSEIGFRILNSSVEMKGIANIVLCHHEHYNGNGYPRGIKGEEIPFQSRIISVADAYDAMVSKRLYRESLTKEEAKEEINRCSGTQFDPIVVKLFNKAFDKL